MNSNAPFSFVPIDNRRSTEKPRSNGLSMVIDDGLPTDYVKDVLRTSSAYIDLMKIKTGTARLYPREVLINKLAIYKAANIRPFLGGQFHEYVFAKLGASALQQFYEEALAIGFETIEISDNTVPLTPKQRHDQIANATRAGLDVFGEVGSKETMSNPMLLVEQAQICFDAGAKLVLVEAAELVENGRTREDTLNIIKTKLPSDKIMIELPGPWIQGVRSCDIEDMKKIVFKEFGPNVNLANIDVKTIYDTEVQRIGLGTSGPLDS